MSTVIAITLIAITKDDVSAGSQTVYIFSASGKQMATFNVRRFCLRHLSFSISASLVVMQHTLLIHNLHQIFSNNKAKIHFQDIFARYRETEVICNKGETLDIGSLPGSRNLPMITC